MDIEVEERINKLESDNKLLKTALISVIGLAAVGGVVALVKENKYSALKEMGMNALKKIEKRWDETK